MKERSALTEKEERHLRIFFAGTLAWTWTVGMLPVAFGISNTDYGNLIFVFTAGIAPSAMGFIMVFATCGPEAKKRYFRQFIPTWRGFWFVLLYAVLLLGVSTAALTLLPNEKPDFGIWHIPWIFYAAQWQSRSFRISPLWFGVFLLSTIATSFMMSITYTLSERNCFVAASIHAVSNAILGLFYTDLPLAGQDLALVSDLILSAAVSFTVLVIFRKRFSARFRAVAASAETPVPADGR